MVISGLVNPILLSPYYIDKIKQGAAVLPKENAFKTVGMMKNCQYAEVHGNHQTMLYGEGANQIVTAIKEFV